MKSRAAIAWEAGAPLVIEEIDVASPQSGEVMIRMSATSVCQWDALSLMGKQQTRFPCVLGHEGAGVVVELGPNVTSLRLGDHVIPLFMPECGTCIACMSHKTNLCQALETTQPLSILQDGTSRFSLRGEPIYQHLGLGTFSEYLVVPEIALARINPKAPLSKVCLFGCTLTTGMGAVKTAQVPPGATVAVFGIGGIGLSVIQGARQAQASRIIAIDTNVNKFPLAEDFGATDCLNPHDYTDPIASIIMNRTHGGVDYAFECTGSLHMMATALACTQRGWGMAVNVGIANPDDRIAVSPALFDSGRSWHGTVFGGIRGRTQLPEYVEQYLQGAIKIDPFITHLLRLEDINLAFDLLHSGESIRSVIRFN